jgi:hypothetical protein
VTAPWRADEVEALAAMVGAGAPPAVAGRILGRLPGAVERRVRELSRQAAARPVRRCPVCGTRLAAYNPGPNCYAHERAPA